MKTLKTYETYIGNLAKTRKFPNYQHIDKDRTDTDFYFVYDLSKKELGKYLNTWFEGQNMKASDLKQNKIKKRADDFEDYVIKDEMCTVKRVDKKTASHLYDREINPISVWMFPSYHTPKNEKGERLYDMKAMIHSVDDSSYGIWWKADKLEKLKELRFEVMKWVNSQPVINGEEFLDACVQLGADETSKDYN